MQNLTWPDLQTDSTNLDIAAIYSEWPGMEKFKRIKPLFISCFGDLYFVGDDLYVYLVDTLELSLIPIGIKEEQFSDYINNEKVKNEKLLPWIVSQLKEKGVERKT